MVAIEKWKSLKQYTIKHINTFVQPFIEKCIYFESRFWKRIPYCTNNLSRTVNSFTERELDSLFLKFQVGVGTEEEHKRNDCRKVGLLTSTLFMCWLFIVLATHSPQPSSGAYFEVSQSWFPNLFDYWHCSKFACLEQQITAITCKRMGPGSRSKQKHDS